MLIHVLSARKKITRFGILLVGGTHASILPTGGPAQNKNQLISNLTEALDLTAQATYII